MRKVQRNYYENLELNDVSDNKNFWYALKPLFYKKFKSAKNILNENEKILKDNSC